MTSRPYLAARMASVRNSPTAEISDKVRRLTEAGHAVINLGEGELDFDTPSHIKNAGIAAIAEGDTKYTAVTGTAALKAAIIDKYRCENGLDYAPNEVIAGAGAKQLIFNALLATVEPGCEVVIPSPYWVSYPDMVQLAEGRAVIVPCPEATGWKLAAADLDMVISPRTRWVILNSPNNPTGAVYSAEDMKELTDVLLRHQHVLVMADDIYEHVRYGGEFATPAAIEPRLRHRTLTVNGLSKGYSMTGWRIGYAGGPAWLIAAMGVLQSQSTSNPSSISQAAAVAALRGGTHFMTDWLDQLAARRDVLLECLQSIEGLSCPMPSGAFYAFVNCRGLIGGRSPDGQVIASDFDLASYLLDRAHVGVVHGSAFGMSGYFRISYAIDLSTLREACARIKRALEDIEPAARRLAVSL
jgi:aspartate aminotransferase